MAAPTRERTIPTTRAKSGLLRKLALFTLFSAWCAGPAAGAGADVAEAEALFRSGKYDECAKLATAELGKGAWDESWSALKIKSELARGKQAAAILTLGGALRRFPASLSLHLLARDVYRASGHDEEAAAEMDVIAKLVTAAPQRYGAPENRVALGRFFLARGADARKVLDQFYDVATKDRPDFVEAYLATAELALEKQDFGLAADTLHKAPKEAAQDPRFHYLLACAFSNDDRAQAVKELSEALKINPRHVDSLLLQADHLIDAEKYAEAEQVLKQVVEVNPIEPKMWAYRAVIAHLKGDRDAEAKARRSALAPWAKNPEVDHLIGRKLSQKYRFAEGSAYQKRALEMD
ncbi:MAG TPA: tetratricopeptide repeat protein, partial [Isosphaeraceae bacterium]|nr:tetratricopeptide repeat protein [Isosphaeraceae bacterium]